MLAGVNLGAGDDLSVLNDGDVAGTLTAVAHRPHPKKRGGRGAYRAMSQEGRGALRSLRR